MFVDLANILLSTGSQIEDFILISFLKSSKMAELINGAGN